MNYIGISNHFHDASVSLIDDNGNILFCGHSERYSKIKHDSDLHIDLINDMCEYITNDKLKFHYYERPWLTQLRQLYSGQKIDFATAKSRIGNEICSKLNIQSIQTHSHHLSHAAAGFQTSPFTEATIIVIDAIGEFDTISIYDACYDDKGIAVYTKLYSKKYPNSIGLFYSAITKHIGLRPLDEEYITMGMAAYGKPLHSGYMRSKFVNDNLDFKENLHIGFDYNFLVNADKFDIACSAQKLTEELICQVFKHSKEISMSDNLVYCGGVALNCVANKYIGDYYSDIWIMPNPGDSGSSLGAALLGYGKKAKWVNSYLGHNIDKPYPYIQLCEELLTNKIVGVANGRAEFGPRALGNRSILADPRGYEIKDIVNLIKHREKFRPFAPVILEEYVDTYFRMPKNWKHSRYMQVVAECYRPDLYPAIVHVDNTSRVQTVPNDNSGIRKLLELWFKKTGCPMLLNTSLNIRNQPLVNDKNDAKKFENLYKIKVL